MKRILLKLSGEALAPKDGDSILDFDFIAKVAKQIKRCVDAGVQVAVIVGAGNIWRGRQGTGMERCRADHMGMLATAINSIALQDVFLREGMNAVVMTAVEMQAYAGLCRSLQFPRCHSCIGRGKGCDLWLRIGNPLLFHRYRRSFARG